MPKEGSNGNYTIEQRNMRYSLLRKLKKAQVDLLA